MEDDEHEANSTETDIVGIVSINPLISLCLGFTYFFKSPTTFLNKRRTYTNKKIYRKEVEQSPRLKNHSRETTLFCKTTDAMIPETIATTKFTLDKFSIHYLRTYVHTYLARA